ncbi:hypothetical protein [Halobacteriovorax marinus]|uniref:hypothetical protein n=1 Tax=Halobacteriovorax marinus TaxID=97084 RepID=UPI003A8D52E1
MKKELLSVALLLSVPSGVLAQEIESALGQFQLNSNLSEAAKDELLRFKADIIALKLAKQYDKSFFTLRPHIYNLLKENALNLSEKDHKSLESIIDIKDQELNTAVYFIKEFQAAKIEILTSEKVKDVNLDVMNESLFSESRVEILSGDQRNINLQNLSEAGFSESRVEILINSRDNIRLDFLRAEMLSESRIEILVDSGRSLNIDLLRDAGMAESRVEILIDDARVQNGLSDFELDVFRDNNISESRVEILSGDFRFNESVLERLRDAGFSEARVEILTGGRRTSAGFGSDIFFP